MNQNLIFVFSILYAEQGIYYTNAKNAFTQIASHLQSCKNITSYNAVTNVQLIQIALAFEEPLLPSLLHAENLHHANEDIDEVQLERDRLINSVTFD
jgi:hypothetical protein